MIAGTYPPENDGNGPRSIGLIAVTRSGQSAAERLAKAWPDAWRYDGPASAALPQAFKECDAVVCFLAVGATVRLLAPLLDGKHEDPAVVCVDEALRHAVPVLGAHHGGGNALARRLQQVLGAEPVITTASDAAGSAALDEFGADLGFGVEPGSDLAGVGAALLSGERVTLTADQEWPLPPLPPHVVRTDRPEPGVPAVVVTDKKVIHAERAVVYRPPSLRVGVGASRGAPAAEIGRLIDDTLSALGLSPRSVRHVATADAKAGEHGLQAAAAERGWPLVTFPGDRLAAVPVPNPSEVVRRAVGTPSVAEAAALIEPGATLLAAKRVSAHATVAVARARPRGRLAVIGIGPGARDLMTPRAVAELRRAAVVAGLGSYLEQVADLLRPGTQVLASGLGAEQERAAEAVAQARAGRAVALVGSGDAGVYAMGSPALELAGDDIDVTVVPGVTAALAAAAVLGAPLGHDHVMISLSDLHTAWPVIERRIAAAAEGDLVTCFYNPASARRTWQLRRALELLAARRPPGTPVGWVRDATRPGQAAALSTLAEFEAGLADMHTLVVVGSSRTRAPRRDGDPARLPVGAAVTAAVTGECLGCGACLLTCPEHAIRPGARGPLVVLGDLCTGCGECIEVCPADAIEVMM